MASGRPRAGRHGTARVILACPCVESVRVAVRAKGGAGDPAVVELNAMKVRRDSADRPRLRKRFGQHHLVDPALCRPLVTYLEPAGRHVLEIGPGGGVLTRALLDAGARVTALEVDAAWAFTLRRTLAGRPVSIAIADALDLDPSRIAPATLVAGNLPFNVGTPMLGRLLRAGPHRLPRAGVMVQKEVADRLVAVPGTSAYGALTVLVAARARCERLGNVKPGSFRPPPKVAASFVGLRLHEPPVPPDRLPAFEAIVRSAFASRRKTLRNNLAKAWGRREAVARLERAGIDPDDRAERLSLDAFVALARVAEAASVAADG